MYKDENTNEWIMLCYQNEELIHGVIDKTEMGCCKQMFGDVQEEKIINTFKFYWLDGKVEHGHGLNVTDAFSKLGYGAGAMNALDYYEELK